MADAKRKDASTALNTYERNETIYSNMSQKLSELQIGIFQLQEDTEKAADQTIRLVWNRHLTSKIPADRKACGANELHPQPEDLLEKLS